MIHLREHIPSFVDIDRPPHEATVVTVAEMLDLKFVRPWKDQENFHRFSVSRASTGNVLMAEVDEGRRWYVVGFIEAGDVSELPEWRVVVTDVPVGAS